MDTFQNLLDQKMGEFVPRLMLEKLIEKKLKTAGITATKKLSKKLAEYALSGETKPFKYKSKQSADITLAFDEADIKEIERMFDAFCKQLPGLLESTSEKSSKAVLKELTSKWDEEGRLQQVDLVNFRTRLEERWGKPLNQLRMLLTISREWAQTVNNNHVQSKKNRKENLKDILIRLHVRACQVVDEIICLLENGFADGAMARWRTLHEIAVVAAVLSQHGENIVERYIAHQAVESKRSMDKYAACCEQLGYKPLSEKQKQKIITKYNEAIARYGKSFRGDYGWAAEHLKKEKPTFADLEAEAGRAEMRAYHQMANDNVHAGIKSMYIRLGMLENYSGLLAGRSNAGLMEPGQNAAHTLTQISVLVCLSQTSFDDVLTAKVMQRLRDEIPRSFFHVHKQLLKDDRKYKSTLGCVPNNFT